MIKIIPASAGLVALRIDALPAALLKPTPNNGFCDPLACFAAVYIGCIEEINAWFQGTIHNGETVCFAGLGAKIHCA